MFCIQCGLELSKQMQFCPRCGTKIDANVPSSGQPKTSQDATQAIILPLLSQQVRFPNSIESYIDIIPDINGKCTDSFFSLRLDSIFAALYLLLSFPIPSAKIVACNVFINLMWFMV